MLDHQDLSAVQAAAQRAVQCARNSAAAITAIEHWGGGAHNSGFKLLLADGTQLFMKIEKENIFPRSRRGQIEREVYGIRLAAQAGLDVPVIAGYDFTGQTAGCRYLLEEFIDRQLIGEIFDQLPEPQQSALMEEFEQKSQRIYAIRGDAFGDLYPGGWLGRYDSWRETLLALSAILLEDAETLGYYSASDLAAVRDAHAIALDAIVSEGPAILTHNDLHIFNAFVEQDSGQARVGKLFDFGLSLFQAEYTACVGPKGFDGQEAQVARRYGVPESELYAQSLVNGLEFVNFANAIRFAPDRPYGCVARARGYLENCQEFLAKG